MIKVLIVDDSALIRKILTEELGRHKDISIIGSAMDPYFARDKILSDNPDVIVLDLEMPRMDGLTFLSKLMKYYPKPVVVFSSLTVGRNETALKALELGAVEVVGKPSSYSTNDVVNRDLIMAIRRASMVKFSGPVENKLIDKKEKGEIKFSTTRKVIAIGASTGGTVALEKLLSSLPASMPGIAVVQHMPEGFTSSFAKRLNEICFMQVKEASDKDLVVGGCVFIAPGNKHMVIERSGANYVIRIKDGPQEHYQRPAVDPLFRSVAKNVRENAVAVLLTGMGADGAAGMLEIRKSGGYTIAQDEKSSLVFGMPKEAIKMGAAQDVLSLEDIGAKLKNMFKELKV